MNSNPSNKLLSWMIPALVCAVAHPLVAQEALPAPKEVDESKPNVMAPAGSPAAIVSAPGDEEKTIVLEAFVVTGTILRGIAPVGSNVISLNQADVATMGAASGNQILATVPQVGNFFNSVPSSIFPGAAAQIQVLRPNLRNLPGGALATGAATLVLIDGHRVAGVGVTTSAIDPDIVPMGALENVEISTDGGSAVYGADAVGGVINFVSRRRFDGAQFDAHYGAADNFFKTGANLTVGKDWGKGSAYLSANWAKSDAILGRDRSYAKRLDYSQNPPVPTGLNTDAPNIQSPGISLFGGLVFLPGTNYAMPDLVPNSLNRVDVLQHSAILPSVERRGAFFSLTQDLSDKVRVDARAFYSKRDTFSTSGPAGGSVSVPSTNPFYIPLPAPVSPTATQTVAFSFGPLLGNSTWYQTTHFDEWGANANVVIDLDDNWQLRTLLNYSKSNSTYWFNDLNSSLFTAYAAGTTTTTAINPYNIASTPNKQLISDILNHETAGQSQDALTNVRSIIDGSLMELPGGKVRLAFGYEFSQSDFKQRFGSGVIGNVNTLAYSPYTRRVNSGFGELALPLFGKDNAVSGIQSLILSAAWRYDSYSDFGHTSNPKFGLTYKPSDWLAVRGNWSTAFNAPTPVDQLGSARNSLTIVPFVAALKPGDTAAPGSWTIALQGSAPNLKPQTSTNYSFGVDIEPPVIKGLTLSASYYHIFFEGTLNKPPVFNAQQLFQNFPGFVTVKPTAAQISDFALLAANTNGPAQVAQFLDGSPPVYELLDFRTTNLGNTALSGLDFLARYRHKTGFGWVDASVGGNYQLSRKTQLSSLAPFTNDLATGMSRFNMQTTLGADYHKLRAQVTWNHTRGFAVLRSATLPQDRVSSFDTINLFFKYDVNGEKLFKDLSVTLNVDNVFDRNPPVDLNTGANGFTNGFTVGRMVMLGVSKKF